MEGVSRPMLILRPQRCGMLAQVLISSACLQLRPGRCAASTRRLVAQWRPDRHPLAALMPQEQVVAIAWSPDGSHVAALGALKLTVLDSKSGAAVWSMTRTGDTNATLSWSADANRLVFADEAFNSSDFTPSVIVRIIHASTGQTLSMSRRTLQTRKLVLSPDGNRL